MSCRRALLFAAVALGLAGCDLLGIETASQVAARREAEGKAIGGACRHAARSIEACYEQNRRADKAAVFAGWREMNDYMRENQIEAMPPPAPTQLAAAEAAEAADEAGDAAAAGHEPGARAEPKPSAGARAGRATTPK
jgi:hypothetical protein